MSVDQFAQEALSPSEATPNVSRFGTRSLLPTFMARTRLHKRLWASPRVSPGSTRARDGWWGGRKRRRGDRSRAPDWGPNRL